MASPAAIIETARAKVNLSLHVLGRRTNGYHELDSIVAFAELGDRLSFEPAQDLALDISGPFAAGVPAGEDNLVLRAVRRLSEALPGRIAPARISLDKRIPPAAGLGGGSADAAATLRGVARLSGIDPAAGWMAQIALSIGADVPVCLESRSCRMRGIGEIIEPIEDFVPGPAVLVNPGVTVATAAVFEGLNLAKGESLPIRHPSESWGPLDRLPRGTASGDASFRWHDGKNVGDTGFRRGDGLGQCRNDLTGPATRLVPQIAEVLQAIEAQPGVTLVRMSGSGATCFGLFSSEAAAKDAALAISARHPGWWCAPTIIGSAMP